MWFSFCRLIRPNREDNNEMQITIIGFKNNNNVTHLRLLDNKNDINLGLLRNVMSSQKYSSLGLMEVHLCLYYSIKKKISSIKKNIFNQKKNSIQSKKTFSIKLFLNSIKKTFSIKEKKCLNAKKLHSNIWTLFFFDWKCFFWLKMFFLIEVTFFCLGHIMGRTFVSLLFNQKKKIQSKKISLQMICPIIMPYPGAFDCTCLK